MNTDLISSSFCIYAVPHVQNQTKCSNNLMSLSIKYKIHVQVSIHYRTSIINSHFIFTLLAFIDLISSNHFLRKNKILKFCEEYEVSQNPPKSVK